MARKTDLTVGLKLLVNMMYKNAKKKKRACYNNGTLFLF